MNGKKTNKHKLEKVLALYRAGNFDAVKSQATTLINDNPRNTLVWKLLGAAYHKLGELGPSLEASQKVIELDPRDAAAQANLGGVLLALGRLEEAEKHFNEAIRIDSKYTEAYKNIGKLYLYKNDLKMSELNFLSAISLDANCAESRNNLANIYYKKGRLEEALIECQKAISIRPGYAEAYNTKGSIHNFKGEIDSAESCYREAINLKENFSDAYNNLGSVLRVRGEVYEAIAAYEKVLLSNPHSPEAYNNLGNVYMDIGNFQDAENCYREAINNNSYFLEAHSNLLFLYASVNIKSERYLIEARKYGEKVTSAINQKFCYLRYPDNKSVLKVGFVSGDFKNHPVGYFLEKVLFELANRELELYAYTLSSIEDALTNRIKPIFKKWTSLVGKTWAASAREIYEEKIDILIDLSGHTGRVGLPIFSYKPAPMQISWLGYFASTGMSEIDYIIGDRYVTPKIESKNFIEEIYQLPNSYICYSDPEFEVDVNLLPALNNGYITFGCFSKMSRMSEAVISAWSQILTQCPNSKLLLKDKKFKDSYVIRAIREKFAFFGIANDQLIFETNSKRKDYYKTYNRIDIALAPFPYAGATTCVDSLWMGVPFIALKGNQFLSHLAETVLRNIGLQNLIAISERDYVNKVLLLSSDLNALSKLRSILRSQLESSPLLDHQRFASDFNEALRNIWNIKLKGKQ